MSAPENEVAHTVRQEAAPVTPDEAFREAVVDVVGVEVTGILGDRERHGSSVPFLPRGLSQTVQASPCAGKRQDRSAFYPSALQLASFDT